MQASYSNENSRDAAQFMQTSYSGQTKILQETGQILHFTDPYGFKGVVSTSQNVHFTK